MQNAKLMTILDTIVERKKEEVAEAKVPELDEELFEAFGVTEGGEEAFRAEVRSNMQREMDGAIRNQVKQQVMDELARLHEFQVPHAIVHREIHVLKDQMLQQFQMPAGAQAPELPDELFSDQAEKRVRIGLVVNEVISKEDMQADEERVEQRLQEMAAPYGEPEQVVNYFRSQPEQMQNIEMGVLEDQVVDHIMNVASVEVLESNYEDVISGRAIPQPEVEAADEGAEVDSADAEAEPEVDAQTDDAGEDQEKA